MQYFQEIFTIGTIEQATDSQLQYIGVQHLATAHPIHSIATTSLLRGIYIQYIAILIVVGGCMGDGTVAVGGGSFSSDLASWP